MGICKECRGNGWVMSKVRCNLKYHRLIDCGCKDFFHEVKVSCSECNGFGINKSKKEKSSVAANPKRS